jgi:hypothetical protein
VLGRCLWVAAALSLWAVSPAVGALHHPKGVDAPFADCPLDNPATAICLFVRITSGEIVIGHRTVPISRPLAIQGGLIELQEGSLENVTFVGAEDGHTLVETPLTVPGGLQGLSGVKGASELSVVPELVGPAGSIEVSFHNLLFETGVAMRLPLKAKISNRLLPVGCQVGSGASPMFLELTTGTTSPPLPGRPIKGKTGDLVSVEEENGVGKLLRLYEDSLVDNAFSAPVATGCGSFTQPVDSSLGLPSPAGRNTAVLTGTIELTSTEQVKASE